MRLKFKATELHKHYYGAFNIADGEVSPEISDEQGQMLLEAWPKNFSKVTPDKMVHGAKDK